MPYKIQYRISRYLLPVFLLILLFSFVGGVSAQSPVEVEVDRTSLSTDELLTLTITIASDSLLNAPQPILPSLAGFAIVGSSSSSQVSIVNADITTVAVYRYRLQPYETGELIIDPIAVTLDGQTYSSQPLTVHVSQGVGAAQAAPSPSQPGGQPAAAPTELSGQDLFVEAEVDNPRPYVGEGIVYTFRFYQAVNLWNQPQYQGPSFQGFWAEPQSEPQEYRAQVAGRTYRVTEIRSLLFPSLIGPTTIEAARIEIPGGLFSAGRTLQTQPVELEAQALPPDPTGHFQGAVGHFGLEVTVDTTQGRVNEPLIWQVTLDGQGNISAAPDPTWPEMPGWRSFESQASANSQQRDGQLLGRRVYERLLVPSQPGDFTIPALEYVYFDPEAGQYQTARSEPIPVSVAPGDPGAAAAQPVARALPPGADKETVEQTVADIRHLKAAPAELGMETRPVTASPLYWAAWLFPVFGAAGYFTWQRRQRFWENNAGLARRSKARKKAKKALAQARRQSREAGYEAYTTAGQILTAYLADKLDRPIAGLTHQSLADLLAAQGIDADLVERVEVLLTTSEVGRFAPGADDPGYASSLLQETEILIDALDKEIGK